MLTVDLTPPRKLTLPLAGVEQLWQGCRVLAGVIGDRPVVTGRYNDKIVFVDLRGVVHPTGARLPDSVDEAGRSLLSACGLRELYVFDTPAEFATWLAGKTK